MSFKSLLCSAVLALLGGTVAVSAASSGSTKPKAPPPTGNRYLFIVENSLAMEKRDESTRQTIFELINTGLKGRMLPGDTFGVWSFNSQPETRFPMQVWDSATRLDSATRVNLFLKDLGYRRRGNFERVWRDLQAVVASVKEVTVILLTDGSDRISGTPFDREINTAYREYGNELSAKRQPFVTALAIREGNCIAYSVTHPGEDIILPPPSEKSAVRSAPLANAERRSWPEEPVKPAPNTNAPPRRVASIIVTRESVARDVDPIGPSHAPTPAPTSPPPPPASPAPQPLPLPAAAATTSVIPNSSGTPTSGAAGFASSHPVSTGLQPGAAAPVAAVSQPIALPSQAASAPVQSVVPPPSSSPARSQPLPAAPATTPPPVSVPQPPAPAASTTPTGVSPAQPAGLSQTQTQPQTIQPSSNSSSKETGPSHDSGSSRGHLPVALPGTAAAAGFSAATALPLATSTIPSPTAVVAEAPANRVVTSALPPVALPGQGAETHAPGVPTTTARSTSEASVPTPSPAEPLVVQARQPATSPDSSSAKAGSAMATATAGLKLAEPSGLSAKIKLVLASLMLLGAFGCFWVHQQRARRNRQSSFISRALPRSPAAPAQPKR